MSGKGKFDSTGSIICAMNSEFNIPTANPTQEFKVFIDVDLNERIIFSGIFGIGKTTFLKNFFESYEQYEAIHLYPTNYSVASNDDIFELIKVDILYGLLCKDIHLDKEEISTWESLKYLQPEQSYKLFKSFLSLIPETGEKVVDILKALETLIEIIAEAKEKNQIDEAKQIRKLFAEVEKAKGSIYENDFYTQLITKLIARLRFTRSAKIILIVDDLDRIDPEHIFRIINIFAVHFDAVGEHRNKFGFDKIILSCDINNIRDIFKHKYGVRADFNGYIDKFYSTEIFVFDNKEQTKKQLENLVSSIHTYPESVGVPNWKNTNSPEHLLLVYLMNSFIYSNRLNLRSLRKLKESRFHVPIYHVRFHNNLEFVNSDLPLLQVFDFLSFAFGSAEGFLDAANHLAINDFKATHGTVRYAYGNFILYLLNEVPNINAEQPRGINKYVYSFHPKNMTYAIENSPFNHPRVSLNTESLCTYDDFVELFKQAVKRYVVIRSNQY